MSQTNSYEIKTKEMVKVAASGWLGTAMYNGPVNSDQY